MNAGSGMSNIKESSLDDSEVNNTRDETNSWNDPKFYPEGGTGAWLTVAGAAACLFVSFGWVNCNGIFQNYYNKHHLKEYTESDVAWIASLQVFFVMFGGPFVGKIFDTYGPHYPLAIGSILHVVGLMMTSISKEYYQLILSQAVCSAIGASMVYYPATTCVSTWFFRRRGTAMGIVTAGSSLGGVILPIMVIHLMPKFGFGWTIRTCAFLILVLLIFANLTIRSRFRPVKRPFEFTAMIRPLKEPAFACLSVAVFFYVLGMILPFTYIVIKARSQGMSQQLADYLVPILNSTSIFGRIIPNIIADRIGRFNVMIMVALFTGTLVLGLWLPAEGEGPSVAFAALFGIASGSGIALSPVLCAQISPIEDIGIRTGTVLGAGALGALIGPPLGGLMIARSGGSLQGMMVFAGLSSGVSVVFYIAARVFLVKWKVMTVV